MIVNKRDRDYQPYKVTLWQERDRVHVGLTDRATEQEDIADWWDDDARQMFEDGFFDGRNLERSVIDYAYDVGLLPKKTKKAARPAPAARRLKGRTVLERKSIAKGGSVQIEMTAAEVRAFKAKWPNSGLPDRAMTFMFTSNGDLTDVIPETLINSARVDGSAISALAENAWKWHLAHPAKGTKTARTAKTKEFSVPAHKKTEERIVRALIRFMKAKGFRVYSVYDGEEEIRPKTETETLAAIFAVDESSLRFAPAGSDDWHGVLLIGGNDEDVISDWNYDRNDRDGFNAAMEAFNATL